MRTVTWRSPSPSPDNFGNPWPRRRRTCPPVVPDGITSTASPEGVGTRIRAPRIASQTLIGISQWMLSPLRSKNGCSWTRVLTIRSPRGPPNGPALPSPRTRICEPESTPAGIVTDTGSTARRTPRPPQEGHRASPTTPVAPHLAHGENRGTSSRRLVPRTTSANASCTVTCTSSPRRPAASAAPSRSAWPNWSYIARAAGSLNTRYASSISPKRSRARASQKFTSGEYCRASRRYA